MTRFRKTNRIVRRKCSVCLRLFPIHLVQPMVIDGDSWYACPLCALEIRNEHAGLPPDTPFQGEIAKQMYDEAEKYIEEYGEKSRDL